MKKKKERSGRLTSAARRAQLIEVGRAVFAESGYEATSVEEIAARAMVSKPILYSHIGALAWTGLRHLQNDQLYGFFVRRNSTAGYVNASLAHPLLTVLLPAGSGWPKQFSDHPEILQGLYLQFQSQLAVLPWRVELFARCWPHYMSAR